MNYKISVIVPFFFPKKKFYNSDDKYALSSFNKCLSSVYKSVYKKYEVILVSDDSNDESLKIANQYPFKIIKLKKNFGAAYSRNKGVKIAKGEILLFLDSDVEIKKNALSIINNYNNRKNNHGVLQGVYSHKQTYKNAVTQYLVSYHCYYLFLETQKKNYTKSFCTCFVSIKKEIFYKNKGFDNNFTKADPEDIDLGYRMTRNGYKIPLEKKLKGIHHIHLTAWSFIKRTLRIHTNEMKMYLRNKNISMKIEQSNYSPIIFGMVLIFLKIFLATVSFFYVVPNFEIILITLFLLFLVIHLNFLRFIFNSKGLIITLKTIIYIFLHRFLFIICFFKGFFDFYFLKKKY